MEKAMAPHSSTLAWEIPWMEEPGRLQSMGSRRVRLDWAPSFSLFTFMHWRRKWHPTPVLLPGNHMDGGAWWAAIYGVVQSRTRLKRLSSSSSINWNILRHTLVLPFKILINRQLLKILRTGAQHSHTPAFRKSLCRIVIQIINQGSTKR